MRRIKHQSLIAKAPESRNCDGGRTESVHFS